MQRNVFVTGFPGFIAKQLVHRLVNKDGDAQFTFLIQEKLREVAEAALRELDGDHPGLSERSTLVAGDITQTRLGLPERVYRETAARTTHAWHLAAVYDLAVPEAVAYRVNVIGTANVLDFCEDAAGLERLDYVSTCYVSGDRTGTVLESELDEGQRFKNHYESTKCWAEMEVRRRQHRLPVAIHRPGIVVGDSRTGYTDKYDGPYFIIRLLMRMPRWVPMVNIGDGQARPNLVPVDFVVDAMAELWTQRDAPGKTFALADPNPHSSKHIVDAMLEAMGRRGAMGRVSASLVESALGAAKLRQAAQIPKEAVIYFNHRVDYDTSNTTAALEHTGVRCPDLLAILPTLVDYVREHPHKEFLDQRRL